jgi:hypothetical protein
VSFTDRSTPLPPLSPVSFSFLTRTLPPDPRAEKEAEAEAEADTAAARTAAAGGGLNHRVWKVAWITSLRVVSSLGSQQRSSKHLREREREGEREREREREGGREGQDMICNIIIIMVVKED